MRNLRELREFLRGCTFFAGLPSRPALRIFSPTPLPFPWIRNSKGKSDDIKVIKKHLENLLECKSESEFEFLFSEYKNLWSKDFLTYFEDNVLLDLKTRPCRNVTNKFAAFKDKIPTNNISESLHKMIKSQNDWKELPVDALILSLFHFQMNFIIEFNRATKGLGNFNIKKAFSNLVKLIAVPENAYLPLDKIINKIKLHLPFNSDKPENYRMSQKHLAALAVEKGFIAINSQTKSCTVRHPFFDNVHTVTFKDGKINNCSCSSSGLCFHKIAIIKSFDCEISDNNTYNLSILRRKGRGKETKLGRKFARKKDLDITVNPAPDSIAASFINTDTEYSDFEYIESTPKTRHVSINESSSEINPPPLSTITELETSIISNIPNLFPVNLEISANLDDIILSKIDPKFETLAPGKWISNFVFLTTFF